MNAKTYSVICTAIVGKGKTLAQDFFQEYRMVFRRTATP